MHLTEIAFSFAFQPIVNVASGNIVSFEALVRGPDNESAGQIFKQISADDLYEFDELLRLRAIPLAAELGVACKLNLNLLPGSIAASDAAIASTVAMARQCGVDPERITLEVTESEIIDDVARFVDIVNEYRSLGVQISIDDFGAGYSGLNLLADFQPDNIKLDISLVRNIDKRGPRQAIIRGINRTCCDLGIEILAEGVETLAEYWWFREEGIELFQGYLFAKPGFQHLPVAFYPDD